MSYSTEIETKIRARHRRDLPVLAARASARFYEGLLYARAQVDWHLRGENTLVAVVTRPSCHHGALASGLQQFVPPHTKARHEGPRTSRISNAAQAFATFIFTVMIAAVVGLVVAPIAFASALVVGVRRGVRG